MADAIRKTPDGNGIYQFVRSVHTPDYTSADWEINPDISGVSGVSTNYWKYDGTNVVVEMSQAEKDAVDASLAASAQVNAEPYASLFYNTQPYNAGQTIEITLPEELDSMIVHVFDPMFEELTNATLLSPGGTGWDPGNVSTGEANINNGNFADLTYNNSAAGNTSGLIYGIDMGAPTTINAMRRYDYNASYYDTSWEFIGTNDATGVTYDVIFTASQTAAATVAAGPYFRTFSDQSYRYYGVRCVKSFNATYSIISELELLTGTLLTVEKDLQCGTDYNISITAPNTIQVTNLGEEQRTFKTVAVGK